MQEDIIDEINNKYQEKIEETSKKLAEIEKGLFQNPFVGNFTYKIEKQKFSKYNIIDYQHRIYIDIYRQVNWVSFLDKEDNHHIIPNLLAWEDKNKIIHCETDKLLIRFEKEGNDIVSKLHIYNFTHIVDEISIALHLVIKKYNELKYTDEKYVVYKIQIGR